MRSVPALAVLLALAAPALAEEDTTKPPPLQAIQQRKFRLDHEIDVAGALLPLDAFYKGVGPEVAYTYHFTDIVAWEVVRGFYAQPFQTKLKQQLIADFQYPDTAFEEVQLGASSMLYLKPLYGKYSLSNETVVHTEIHLGAGGTLVKTSTAFKPGPIGGVGLRVFLSESISVRFDVRYSLLMGRTFVNVVTLALGFGFNFGSAD